MHPGCGLYDITICVENLQLDVLELAPVLNVEHRQLRVELRREISDARLAASEEVATGEQKAIDEDVFPLPVVASVPGVERREPRDARSRSGRKRLELGR